MGNYTTVAVPSGPNDPLYVTPPRGGHPVRAISQRAPPQQCSSLISCKSRRQSHVLSLARFLRVMPQVVVLWVGCMHLMTPLDGVDALDLLMWLSFVDLARDWRMSLCWTQKASSWPFCLR